MSVLRARCPCMFLLDGLVQVRQDAMLLKFISKAAGKVVERSGLRMKC